MKRLGVFLLSLDGLHCFVRTREKNWICNLKGNSVPTWHLELNGLICWSHWAINWQQSRYLNLGWLDGMFDHFRLPLGQVTCTQLHVFFLSNFIIIIHQMIWFARSWSKRVMRLNLPQDRMCPYAPVKTGEYPNVVIWLAPWAGKMSQILRCDWLPERVGWSYLAARDYPARDYLPCPARKISPKAV